MRLPTVLAFSVLTLAAHETPMIRLADRTMGLAVLLFALRWRLEYLLNELKKGDEEKRGELMTMMEYLRKEIKYQVHVFLQRSNASNPSTASRSGSDGDQDKDEQCPVAQ